MNFHPAQSMQNPPTTSYVQPPAPSTSQSIERYSKEEPAPVAMPSYIAVNPQVDSMNRLIDQQAKENEMLEQELEALKQGGPVDNIPDVLAMNAKELVKIKQDMAENGVKAFKGRADNNEAFPEDFVFRQNEFRVEDLEVEERALMHLQA